MATLKLTAVGTSTGVVIPKEMLARMKVARGDKLHLVETPDGYLLTPYDPAVAAQVEAGREFEVARQARPAAAARRERGHFRRCIRPSR
jgi:putative addiction module antidote